MHVVRKAVSFFLLTMVAATLLAGCKGGTNSTASVTPPTGTFKYTISGLTVSFDSTGSQSADGSAATSTWTFGDQVTSSTTATTGTQVSHTYAEPGNYDVSLLVTDDHGSTVTISHNINLPDSSATSSTVVLGVEGWAWVGGGKYVNNTGTFETEFNPDPLNQPSARQMSATWYSSGKFWMFGGGGYDSVGTIGVLNDLWNCTPSTTSATPAVTSCVWTWVGGSNKANASGVYPSTAGTFSATSLPGARTAGATWTDLNGNMWLFGGSGLDSKGNSGVLNDMWSFSITGQSEWVSGANVVNDQGNTSTTPPSRAYAATWTDRDGNFWLFGGEGTNSAGTTYYLNDLWCFTPAYVDSNNNAVSHACNQETASDSVTPVPGKAITAGTWTLVSAGTANGSGAYGTILTPKSTNIPGARLSAQAWADNAGNLWLFGGSGYDSAGTVGSMNDVWRFNIYANAGNSTPREWTYMTGATTAGATEVVGTRGIYASGNAPSARLGTSGWTDANGTTLWLFGGSGSDSTATSTSSDGGGALNELWAFDTTSLKWAWVAGSNTAGQAGVYPALPQGVPSKYGMPGSRLWSNLWVDSGSNVWLFGGAGDDAVGSSGYLTDLWRMTITNPPSN